ncbi:MAG: hypothetical protein WEG40_19030 [Candidatus Rokuibacteriota bacterium]
MRVVVDRVSKTYIDRRGTDRRGRDVVALSQVDFAVESEEFVALLGPFARHLGARLLRG